MALKLYKKYSRPPQGWEQLLTALSALDPAPAYLVASGSLPPGVPTDFYARVARTGRRREQKRSSTFRGKP